MKQAKAETRCALKNYFKRDWRRVATTSQSTTAGACFTNAVIRDVRTTCWILNAWNSSLCQWRQENNSTWQNTNSNLWLSSMRGPRKTGIGANWGREGNWQRGKGLQLNRPKAWKSDCDVGHLIRLTDKMGIFPTVNIINKQRNKKSPSSPWTYNSYLLV